MPSGYFLRRVQFNCVVNDNDKSRVLLAEIQNLADRQRLIDLKALFAQVLAEARQFAGEVN